MSGITVEQGAQIRRKLGVAVERVGDDDLGGLEPRDLGGKPHAVAFGDAELAGRDIDPAERKARVGVVGRNAGAHHGEEIVVAPRVEQRVLGQGAGGDEADDVPPHDALAAALLGLGRVFELFADRDAMTLRDQAVQIFVGAVHRHAAHRDVLAEVLAALGQHDAERTARDLGILEEQLVEVAHPVEQQAARIGGLDLEVLLHDRRDGRAAPSAGVAQAERG